MKILITGGAGMIGTHLALGLRQVGHEVICLDLAEQIERSWLYKTNGDGITFVKGSILDRTAVHSAMKDGVDVVYHLGAMLGVANTEANSLKCFEVNVEGTKFVLEGAVFNGIPRFINASSSEVYGEPLTNPISETHPTQGKTLYGISKLAAEEYVKGYQQRYPQLSTSTVRFFNTYGEYQVAQFVLSKWIDAVMNGKPPMVYGDGSQIRSYCHVSDTVNALLNMIDGRELSSQVYNIGNSSQVYTLLELAQLVVNIVAPESGLEPIVLNGFNGSDRIESREIFSRICDNSLAIRDLDFDPKVSVAEGINRIKEAGLIYENWKS